jgi:hypothetical protein
MAVPNLTDAIRENATTPQSITTRDGSVTSVSVQDQIAAARFLASETAKAKNHLGLTFRQLEPGGCG